MGLTYENSRISATLCDVGSDVGKGRKAGVLEKVQETAVVSTRVMGRKLKPSRLFLMRLMRDRSAESPVMSC